MKKYGYSESVFNTTYIEIKHRCYKNFLQEKTNDTKKTYLFLLRAPNQHIFTFNLQFLNELKHKVHVLKNIYGIFHFSFCFAFIKVYIFIQQNPHTAFLQDLWSYKIQWHLHDLELPKKLTGDKFFKLRKSKFWERHFLSVVTF